jgi:hypothetical protein
LLFKAIATPSNQTKSTVRIIGDTIALEDNGKKELEIVRRDKSHGLSTFFRVSAGLDIMSSCLYTACICAATSCKVSY